MDGHQHQRQVNPAARRAMHNPVVLEQIGASLAGPDLSTLRQTVRVWNESFVPEFRKKHEPVQLRSDAKVKELTELLRSSNQIPFSKYSFGPHIQDLDEFTSLCGPSTVELNLHLDGGEEGEEDARMEKIRKLIFEGAPQLERLSFTTQPQPGRYSQQDHNSEDSEGEDDDEHDDEAKSKNSDSSEEEDEEADEGAAPKEKKARLEHKQVSDDDENEEVDAEDDPEPQVVLPKLPRLKTLRFFHFMLDDDFQALVCDLLASADGLQELNLHWEHELEEMEGDDSLVFLPLLEAIRDSVPARANFAKLKSLSLARVRAADLEILLQLAIQPVRPLQLESLSTSVISRERERNILRGPLDAYDWADGAPDEPTAALFHSFLLSQEPSLLKLALNIEDCNVAPLRIPRLERLHTFRLEDAGSSESELVYDGGFADAFPALKSTWLFEVFEADRQVAHPGVTQLVVQMTLDKLVHFGPLFPGVSRAQLYLQGYRNRADVCARIWSIWPGLTSLHVEGHLTMLNWGALLSGMTVKGTRTVQRKLDAMKRQHTPITADKLRKVAAKFKARPGLANLLNLQKLTLSLRGLHRAKLTDLVGYFGLGVASPRMQVLRMDGAVVNQLSAGCSEYLDTLFTPPRTFRIKPASEEENFALAVSS